MEGFLPLFFFVGFAFAIAYFIGRERQIGFGWSLFFCFFLTPIGGFIITMSSKKYSAENPTPSKLKNNLGWVLLILFAGSVFVQIKNLTGGGASLSVYDALFVSIGFAGLGYYLVELSKGKRFNTKKLTEEEE